MAPDSPFSTERLESFFDACNEHDIDRIGEFFTADGVYLASVGPDDGGTSFLGVDEVRRGFTGFFAAYPDGNYTDVRVFVDGDRGMAQWTFSGTSATGERISYRGVDVFEFVGDLISLKDAYRKERSRPIGS